MATKRAVKKSAAKKTGDATKTAAKTADPSGRIARNRARPTIFLSYRHAPPTTDIASKLFVALVPAAEAWDADVFMDDHDIEPADLFDQKILAALDRTTHFVVLLTNSYWSSEYCRKELARAVERFEKGRKALLLFVKVEELDPKYFTFAKDRVSGRINSDNPLIENVGNVQFLGPFNEARQLVRLQWENEARLGDQLAQLVKRLELVVK
jgi:hypothetical protein